MCSLFSVGSRTSTGQVSSIVYAGMRAAAKTPLPVRSKNLRISFLESLINLMRSMKYIKNRCKLNQYEQKKNSQTKTTAMYKKYQLTRMHLRDTQSLYTFPIHRTVLLPSLALSLLAITDWENKWYKSLGKKVSGKKHNIPFGVSNTNLISADLVNGSASLGRLSSFKTPIACFFFPVLLKCRLSSRDIILRSREIEMLTRKAKE